MAVVTLPSASAALEVAAVDVGNGWMVRVWEIKTIHNNSTVKGLRAVTSSGKVFIILPEEDVIGVS